MFAWTHFIFRLLQATSSLDFNVERSALSEAPLYDIATATQESVTTRKEYWIWCVFTMLLFLDSLPHRYMCACCS